jgi:hypothetical protein
MLQQFVEAFFGFLVKSQICEKEALSLTFLCDWSLVISFFQAHKNRVGRTHYTTLESIRTGFLKNLYRSFFRCLWKDAMAEKRWEALLPKEVPKSKGSLSAPIEDEVVVLDGFEERWRAYVEQARSCAKSFLKRNHFQGLPFAIRADALLKSGVPMSDLVAALERRIYKLLPKRIASRKAAILCRRLAEVALLLAMPTNPGVLIAMLVKHVTIGANLKIRVDVPEEFLRNRGNKPAAGGLKGELPDWDALHYVLRHYVEEARPILLGPGGSDCGSLFVSANCDRESGATIHAPGGPLDQKAFYHDFLGTVGINPFAVRYLIAADGFRHEAVERKLPKMLRTTSLNLKKTYGRIRATEKGEDSNHSVTKVVGPKRRPSGGL